MAKKKKRAEFNAPSTAKKVTKKATSAATGAGEELSAGASAQKGSVSKGSVSKGSVSKGAATAKSGAKKTPAPAGGRGGMSSNTQWALVIGAIGLVIGGVLLISILGAGGGSGVLEANAWDIPARAGDTDNGDDDGRLKLADFSGTPTVVNFFASWCTDCDRELPHFTRVGETYRDQFDMVFVNSNEDGKDWRDMMDRHDIVGSFPIGKDIKGTNRNGLLRELGGNTGMPATAFYDSNGRLIKLTRGVIEEATLRNEIAALGVQL